MSFLLDRLRADDDDPRPAAYNGTAHVVSPVGVDDELLELVANARRRRVIRYLATGPDVVEIGDLADALAPVEAEHSVDPQARKRVYVALYQTHVPKLVAADVLAETHGRISTGPRFQAAAEVLFAIEEATGGEGA